MELCNRQTAVGFSVIEMMIVTAIMAILAIVAVPAIVTHARRAHTAEAIQQLERLYENSAVYFATPHYDSKGSRLPCQGPGTQGVTPAEGTCCKGLGGPDADDDGRCDNTSNYWDQAVWNDLDFVLKDQHYYVYSYRSEGSNGQMRFVATAHGDLDCDGNQSTFERSGVGEIVKVDNKTQCGLQGAGDYKEDRPTE